MNNQTESIIEALHHLEIESMAAPLERKRRRGEGSKRCRRDEESDDMPDLYALAVQHLDGTRRR